MKCAVHAEVSFLNSSKHGDPFRDRSLLQFIHSHRDAGLDRYRGKKRSRREISESNKELENSLLENESYSFSVNKFY